MTVKTYEAVIVGGGPAGSAAGYTLASQGLNVCILDKCHFPREKLCGGLITLRSKEIFENTFRREWDERLFKKTDEVRFLMRGRLLSTLRGQCPLYPTMRFDFDNYLLSLAAQAGCKLRLGNAVSKIEVDNRTVVLADGSEIGFTYLIGADGVNTVVGRTLYGRSFNPMTIGFALEVEVPRNKLPERADAVDIDFGSNPWGYGWVFPKHKTFTVGVGGLHRLNKDMKASLAAFLLQHGLNISEFKVKGQYIPVGDFRPEPGQNSILLCGDAAGFVDPITGEGIAYAMQSGRAAAIAILRAQAAGAPLTALDEYIKQVAPILDSLKRANSWRWLIFPKFIRPAFEWAFADASTLQKGFMDILSGRIEYKDLPPVFGKQLVRAFNKLVLRRNRVTEVSPPTS